MAERHVEDLVLAGPLVHRHGDSARKGPADGLDPLAVDHLFILADGDGGLELIVSHDDLRLLPQDAALGVDLFEGEFRSLPHIRPHGGKRAGKWE